MKVNSNLKITIKVNSIIKIQTSIFIW